MLRETLQAGFNDAMRGEDREGHAPPASMRPPVLRRRTIRLMAAVAFAGVLYGSLAPFDIDSSRAWDWGLGDAPLVPSDGASNVLIYIPIGICARLLVRRRGSWRIVEWLFGIAACAGLSYTTEVTQTILAGRISSWADVACNLLGGVVGVAAAPWAQRLLRNQHAWLYEQLRRRPFAAAASGLSLAIFFAALMPFDMQPSPGHLWHGIAHAGASLAAGPLAPAEAPSSAAFYVEKLTAAGAFLLLGCLMLLAGCEAGRTIRSAWRYTVSRCILLAACIEGLQLLTISHVADPWDFLFASLFAVAGAEFGAAWARRCTPAPEPAVVLRAIVATAAMGVAARLVVHRASTDFADLSGGMPAWLPLAHSWHRPWHAVLAESLSALTLYLMIAGLVMLWCRSRRRRPPLAALMLATGAPLAAGQILSLLTGRSLDTGHVIFAGIAVAVAAGVDRALFGRRPVAPAAATGDCPINTAV